MSIKLLDHVIITENSYYSFQSSGLLERLEASNNYVMPYELERQFHEEMEGEIKRIEQESKKRIKESLHKGEEKGLKKGRQEGKIEIARSMLQEGFEPNLISKITGISLQEIEKLKTEL